MIMTPYLIIRVYGVSLVPLALHLTPTEYKKEFTVTQLNLKTLIYLSLLGKILTGSAKLHKEHKF
jgi:hypothetical protein